MSHISYLLLAIAAPIACWATEPYGYYESSEGLCGRALIESLEETINNHTAVGYNGLWDLYTTTDTYPDGKIWDMYSTKHWQPGREQCGSYSSVGDCYNREHSFPKSWFDDAQPMYCDAFHIYPTDGKVNGQRSNYPYGECANGSRLPSSGGVQALGKLGSCTFPGYSGVVFEPDDEYKGDFARSYFYMATCYNRLIDDWNSPMLAGNTYPAFSSWAVNLLLKWHRMDPVSEKEKNRNEAVYARQHNRNPFIDHPELAEHIWGDKKNVAWSLQTTLDPVIAKPVDGAVYDFDVLTVGGERTISIDVKGINLNAPIELSSNDAFFTIDRDKIPADQATAGTAIDITWDAEDEGQYVGHLTFSSGSAFSTITLKGVAVDGITAFSAKEVTDRSFVASWTYVGDEDPSGYYTVCYRKADASQPVRVKVKATLERAEISGLESQTEYAYWVESMNSSSNVVAFSTTYAMPVIELFYDGELYLIAAPGEPSKPAEIIVDCENIEGDINVAVSAPFEVSSDKASWSRSLAISPEEDRFYLRLNGMAEGVYTSSIKLSAGDYINDQAEVTGVITSGPTFIEDFEANSDGCDTYNGCDFAGTFANWHFDNAGIWASDKDSARSGIHCVRMGKTNNSCIAMTSDKERGLGIVAIHACRWTANEGDCQFRIDYSTDGGASWQPGESFTVNSDQYQEFSFDISKPGLGRIRVQQTAGARFIIDDISITDYVANGLEGIESDYHAWDAFCRSGMLTIETENVIHARVYGVDGIVYFDGELVAGTTQMPLPAGLYIVAVADFSRRVLVK